MPAFYDRYLGPVLFAPYAPDLARRLADIGSGRVLEIAAGTGIATAALAAALPSSVEIVASDLSEVMLQFAAAKRIAPNIVFRQADAQALPFVDASFGAAACQFGVMFFPDKARAHREIRRVLRPGGRFVFSVWDRIEENELALTSSAALAALFPQDPPSFVRRVPFGYYDRAAIEAELREARFAQVEVDVVAKRLHVPSVADYAVGACQGGPARGEIEARDPEGLGMATAAVADAYRQRFGRDPIVARSQALVFTAHC
jgi:SAM-dependent methyltransferase